LDYDRIKGFTTMTVNYAAMAINEGFDPDKPEKFNWSKAKYHPTYAHWRDAAMGQHMKGYKGVAVVPDGAMRVQGIPFPEGVKAEVYNRREIMEIVGPTSGNSALHAAIMRGFNPIFLLGYDFYETEEGMYGYGEKRSQWFDHHERDGKKDSKYEVYGTSLPHFHTIRVHVAEPNGVDIYNLNKDSMLKEFPYISLDEALEMVQ
jgi:hypothetical protein